METAPAQETVALPEGKLGIHYYRPDGDYAPWGLHLWESTEKVEGDKIGPKMGRDRPLDPINWTSPMKPSGKSDFGVYWHFGASEFGNGKVNYIIHKGDTKDQCGKDMYWLIKDGKEVWVNSGDCEVYMSKEAALKARK